MQSLSLIDSHAHLDDEQFGGILNDVLLRAADAGLDRILSVGTTAGSSRKTVQLARQFDIISAAVGIQPNYCAKAQAGDWDLVQQLIDDPNVVAIGETGLDRYWDHTPFELQQDYFDRHLRLAQSENVPFVVHMRDCSDDILVMLREAHSRGPLRGVMHSFTGDADMARECVGLGMYISFAGMVTYKKSNDLREVAGLIPEDRILIETDSPYLSPHPKRGVRPNEPALLVHTLECVAQCRGMSSTEIGHVITANTRRLFDRMP